MRKSLWPVALVILIASLAGGAVWLSQQQRDGLEAGTLIAEDAVDALVGRTAEVRVPWGSLQVTVSEPLAETAEGTQAGHDASLVGVQVALDGPEDLLVADRLPDGALEDPTFTLVADGEEFLLEGLNGWVKDNQVAQVARRQYVALKGEPAEIALRVGYDGVDQVVDGLTGTLDRSAAEPLYQLGFAAGAQPCGDPLWSPEASDAGKAVTTCLVSSSAQRPYVAGLGWAPEGRSWLVVTLLGGAPTEFAGPNGTYDVAESESTYLLDGQAPDEAFALNDALPAGAVEDANDPQVLVFEVAPDRPTGQFEVRTSLTGETEVATAKQGKGKGRTRTFEALVALGAFV
ncbi:hypothetical protein [Nocardioides allogilvus]|uniref:hypothetical protein n=1 Tax=Nocardioides allogilvus TaxID=2072017 RepID=UPI000D30B5D3|nr:hypothetical protein [Nocardioides allogilvus]